MTSALAQISSFFDSEFSRGSKFLDRNPTLYKTALVIIHICRASMTYTSPLFTVLVILPYSLLYRISVERSCPFRFTFAAMFGAFAFHLSLISPLGMIPLAAYAIMICYISHTDIENHIAKLSQDCCSNKPVKSI